jgi:transcription elongation GreA/GreB family factor
VDAGIEGKSRASELALRIGDADEALRLAYDGASAAAAQPYIQLAYVNIFTQHEDDAIVQDPSCVEVNSRVLLRDRDGETQTYFITDDARVEIRAGELAATDPVAIALVGKRVGESVVLRSGTYSERVLEIVEIRSRFVHLFQDILSNFPKRFPSSAALQAFKVEPEENTGALSAFTRSLEDQEHSESALVDAYDRHAVPLGMLALKLGRTLVDAYGAVCSRAGAPMLVEFSDLASRAKGTLDAQTGIVLTRSALVTCQHLDLLQTLSQHFANLFVPRSLVDELLEEREGLRRYERDGYKGALSRSGQVHLVERSPEAIQLQMVAIDELLAWVSSSCVASPRPLSALSLARERAKLIGVSSTDALALLSAENTQLYADDLGLRRIGLAETGKIGLCTYALVEYLRSIQVLTPDLADQMHGSLLLLNHAAIPISPRAVFAQLQMSGFRIDKQVQFLLDRVKASDAAQADKAVFLAELLRLSALSTQGKIHLGSLALSACEVVRAAGGGPAARALLRRAAEMRLRLLPEHQDVVLAVIERVFSRVAQS